MDSIRHEVWRRRGFSVIWNREALKSLLCSGDAISIRAMTLMRKSWPETLPCENGNAVVVTGLENCIDALSPHDAETWLEEDIKPLMLSFQHAYDGQAALILWLSAESRITCPVVQQRLVWNTCDARHPVIEFGRCLWGGAQEYARLIEPDANNRKPYGNGFIGIYLDRLS